MHSLCACIARIITRHQTRVVLLSLICLSQFSSLFSIAHLDRQARLPETKQKQHRRKPRRGKISSSSSSEEEEEEEEDEDDDDDDDDEEEHGICK